VLKYCSVQVTQIIIIIRNLYSVIMPLGGYRGVAEQVGRIVSRKQ